MSTINGISFQDPRNINLKGGALGVGVLRFTLLGNSLWSTNPFASDDAGLYLNASGQLVYSYQGATTVLGAGGGGGGVPTWEQIFAADQVFTITPDTTFTIGGNRSTATNVLTLSNVVGGSGATLAFSNSGSGNDITGTSSTWGVTAAGVATVAGISISGTSAALTTTGAAVWTLEDNTQHSLKIGAAGQTGMIDIDTRNGAEVVNIVPTLTVTGNIIETSASNTVVAALVTNNTVTTFGASQAANAGVAVICSTSLTTGTLLRLQVAEGTLNGGYYLEALDTTGGTSQFTVGKHGAVTIAGSGGTTALTISAGDVSVTDNTSTATTVLALAGSSVYTGSTTTSFVTVTPSGLTTGTAIYVVGAALTTGELLNMSATAQTSGVLQTITGGGANITTGILLDLEMGAATAGTGLKVLTSGVYAGSNNLALFSANSATTTTGIVSITGTGLTSGSGLLVTGGGTNQTSLGNLVEITSGAATDGTSLLVTTTGIYTGTVGVLTVTANSATSGNVFVINGTGLTTGAALLVNGTSSAVVAVGPNGKTNPTFVIDASTASAATGIKIKSAAAAAGLALSVVSSGTDENLTIDAKGAGTVIINGTATGGITLTTAVTAASSVKSTSATGGIGYATGSGGAVTQASSRTTGVTLNKVTGAITLVSAAGSATPATFTVTNSAVAATDTIILNQKSGTDLYEIFVTAVGAGSFNVTYFTTGGTTTEQPVFNFTVLKGVAA